MSTEMPGLPVSPIQYVKRVWERIAPLQLADRSWDNVGVIIGPVSQFEAPSSPLDHRASLPVAMLLVSANGISQSHYCTYHPPVSFQSPLDPVTDLLTDLPRLEVCFTFQSESGPSLTITRSITMSNPLQASLLKLAARGISVFTPHTSLDATPKGINTWYALSVMLAWIHLMMDLIRLVKPFLDNTLSSEAITLSDQLPGFEGAGAGKLVKLKTKNSVAEIVKLVKDHLGLSYVQIATPSPERPIESIAVCAGSGGGVFKGVTADLLLTGEMSHVSFYLVPKASRSTEIPHRQQHEVLAAIAGGQSVILCNHSNTERPYLSTVLQNWLETELNSSEVDKDWEVLVSKADADPLRTV
ncbi:hypothetical protein P7C73_g2674, partial [Tremellales sp. Uapishka_1]